MFNHIHLIIQCSDAMAFVRDFKKYTTPLLRQDLEKTEPEILRFFENNGKFQIWQGTNMPLVVETEYFFKQKKKYIENNPVKKGYVLNPEDWLYSSASPGNLLKMSAP